ncbi:FHA domain-containing protein [Marinicella gelatinilytica]|uniref:FHA domain-containing protein n=1 Tax=Marinicella gelatinilytica TaxID=2996017 RepID=UPI002260872E|nr:FHA domain-containing protein [Marinicella gelatinilytica]MCX7544345.1 FHA domain-containing protein [Marinicella gelatinilytica]
MKLILEHSEAIFDLPEKGSLLIGNDEDCQVQINRPEIWGRHASIDVLSYGLVLQAESSPILVNGTSISSSCLVYPGDKLMMSDLMMRLVDDDYVPKEINSLQQFNHNERPEDMSSVFGLRQLFGEQNGAFIKSDYHHKDGWKVYRTDAKLALISNNHPVFVNGRQVHNTWLQNGDRLQYKDQHFNVECPGHSGYSKFSPSHPRNVMLSESMSEADIKNSHKKSLRPHYWWLTLLTGLVLLLLIILLL